MTGRAEAFDVETFAEDFAGPGRTLAAESTDRGNLVGHLGRVNLDNGWWFSAIWGWGSYTYNARLGPGDYRADPPARSLDAEVMPGSPNDDRLDLDGDTVAGWISPAQFEAAIRAAEENDPESVVRVLTAEGSRETTVADYLARAMGGSDA